MRPSPRPSRDAATPSLPRRRLVGLAPPHPCSGAARPHALALPVRLRPRAWTPLPDGTVTCGGPPPASGLGSCRLEGYCRCRRRSRRRARSRRIAVFNSPDERLLPPLRPIPSMEAMSTNKVIVAGQECPVCFELLKRDLDAWPGCSMQCLPWRMLTAWSPELKVNELSALSGGSRRMSYVQFSNAI